MFPTKWIAVAATAGAIVLAWMPVAQAKKHLASVASFASEDEGFLALREASRNGDHVRAAQIAARLGNYPVPSYVDYYQLRPRVHLAPEQEIRNFLTRYDGSAIADRLRNDWLLELGRTRNWTLFDEQYPLFVLNDDTQVKCYALMSKAQKGHLVADEARALLVAPQNYGEACIALISALHETGQFSAGDVWAQARLAGEVGNPSALRRLAPVVGVPEHLLLQTLDKADAVVAKGPGTSRAEREMFIIALGRSARANLEQAVRHLVAASNRLKEDELALAWAQIALPASWKLAPDALVYWHRTNGVRLSPDGYQWKARMALRAGEWKLVKSTIETMPSALRKDATWIYWLGRAYRAEGRKDEAQPLFESIAGQPGFYGQLAQEELGRKITLPPRARNATSEELSAASENQGFRRALKFYDMNLRFEGNREWNWELRRMNDRELLAAAEFARQRNVLDRMVATSDRTESEFDFSQRFPSPFLDIMLTSTEKLGLDVAWVYGLIRQESRFILNARSHVGASGLMQLMPATAQFVARKIGLHDFDQTRVNDIRTNITLGTSYLNMVLNDLEGSQALATAAYNAGPGRPRLWRSTLNRSVEGAVFAETIPFTETRDYVKKVLSNATYYAALFENRPQSLKARLGAVAPKGFLPTDLP